MMTPTALYPRIQAALLSSDVTDKLAATEAIHAAWQRGELLREDAPLTRLPMAGHPEKPELVHATKVPRRRPGSPQGQPAMLHAIAHIEFNAVNLALDAAWRFRDMPDDFVSDWLRIAAEEAGHFRLLQGRLQQLGYSYGDFPAHNGLWEICHVTDHDVLVRMALVPRVLEARGLDASPELQRKLANIGDEASIAILDIILRDEIGHVQVGNHWFHYLCRQRALGPMATFSRLLQEYDLTAHRGSYNVDARRLAGFSEAELQWLQQAKD
ncbi:DUF455 domain-containing protein [Aquitalea sp. FJL05]|uniref:ferritin-like domain-containing protein n=1 Tax=Aquitalea TaxID=407217 RepID=UPI000F59885A|nr:MULTISPECIES: ferritin-like domain-containing protein [Aquitalea]RQO75934.1 DUF455 domain-containing protein [Aquitalea sp. FJL05]